MSSINIQGVWYIHMDLFQMDGFLGGAGENNLHFDFCSSSHHHSRLPGMLTQPPVWLQPPQWQGDKWLLSHHASPFPISSTLLPGHQARASNELPASLGSSAPLISPARLIIGDLWSLPSFNKPCCYGNHRQTSMFCAIDPTKNKIRVECWKQSFQTILSTPHTHYFILEVHLQFAHRGIQNSSHFWVPSQHGPIQFLITTECFFHL